MDANWIRIATLMLFIAALAGACGKSKVTRGPEVGGADKGCYIYKTKDKTFEYVSQQATVETKWYDEWTSRHGKTLPPPLPPPDHWMHPKLSSRYAATMHENSFATDVSVEPGPIPNDAKVEYFHVLEKGTKLSGMSPFYTFLDDHTVVTISFGRDSAMLLIVDITGEAKVLDYVALPGRGSGALELASKSARMEMFRDTSGGAYSYLDAKGNVFVPGADNTIIRIPIRDYRIKRDEMVMLDLSAEIEKGSWVDDAMKKPDNHLTAIMPDAGGRVWFTSKLGVVGMLQVEEGSGKCPPVYTTSIAYFALREKVRHFYELQGKPLPDGAEEFFEKVDREEKAGTLVNHLAALRLEAREIFKEIVSDEPLEQIQNSFTVGDDGVYIVTNVALYKLFFNEKTRHIDLDPLWAPNYAKPGLIYDNDRTVKPGHLNNGSGTTPTLVEDRFVAIVDNAPGQVNLNVFRQKDGSLVSKLPLFEEGAGAVENSVVAYEDHLIVGNTYGYVDPFVENPTAGGIMRFDYDEKTGKYHQRAGWPAVGHFDGKTATPKLSTANGLFYVYHRDEVDDAHNDWQLTALDFRSGWPVFSIKGYFTDEDFADNVSGIVKKKTLGKEDYGRKVFNNIWGTFSFGPKNSVFIGTYRGYVRFSSAPTLVEETKPSGEGP
ncbi:MAG: hypothetical protein AAF997_16430 [Myxococcota bacterium]